MLTLYVETLQGLTWELEEADPAYKQKNKWLEYAFGLNTRKTNNLPKMFTKDIATRGVVDLSQPLVEESSYMGNPHAYVTLEELHAYPWSQFVETKSWVHVDGWLEYQAMGAPAKHRPQIAARGNKEVTADQMDRFVHGLLEFPPELVPVVKVTHPLYNYQMVGEDFNTLLHRLNQDYATYPKSGVRLVCWP